MPRGGFRENAGRKSEWASGRTFAETKPIRIPLEYSDFLLEIAHILDAGGTIDLDTESLREENNQLKEQISRLEEQMSRLEDELDQATKTKPMQLSLLSDQPSLSKCELNRRRDEYLYSLKLGEQAPGYVRAKKTIDAFIKRLLKN